jgi:O-acetyl-ADP-ribose deacetylase (regulator of RNase III)|tara:strand:- start:10 stop:954 length:945 start_codon:yes stop_codon:yes gene_type:complete
MANRAYVQLDPSTLRHGTKALAIVGHHTSEVVNVTVLQPANDASTSSTNGNTTPIQLDNGDTISSYPVHLLGRAPPPQELQSGRHKPPPPSVGQSVFFYHQKFGWKTGSVVNNAIPPLGIDVDASMVPNEALNNCISMFQGDITTLNVDAIQNAANNQLFSGGGICGAIYNAACEFDLSREVQRKYPNGCDVGQTAISSGCHLHAKHVLHTVGPRGEQPELLESAYRSTLDMAKAHGCKSVALCCISTGIFGYPPEAAAPIAIRTVKKWLEERQKEMAMSGENGGPGMKIIFCLFLDSDVALYQYWLSRWFPKK